MLEQQLEKIAISLAEIAECLKLQTAAVLKEEPEQIPKKRQKKSAPAADISELVEEPELFNGKRLPEIPEASDTEVVEPEPPEKDRIPVTEPTEQRLTAVVNPYPDVPEPTGTDITGDLEEDNTGTDEVTFNIEGQVFTFGRHDGMKIKSTLGRMFVCLVSQGKSNLRADLRAEFVKDLGQGTLEQYTPEGLYNVLARIKEEGIL